MYKTFTEWKNGNWLEDGEPRKEAYTKDELLLVEVGWKYGFDAGKAQQADRIAHLEMLLANRNEIIDKLDLTTPQIKELSDEEIYKLAGEFWIEGSFDDGELDYVGFARAILKKASEK